MIEPTETTFGLRQKIVEWTSAEMAAHWLAQCLGIVSADTEYGAVKWLYSAGSDIGDALYRILNLLAENRILEKRLEPDTEFRWAPDYPDTITMNWVFLGHKT